MDFDQAKGVIVDAASHGEEQGKTLDDTADELLTRVAQFFGECVGGDTFCGLAIDEKRNEAGILQSLTLVPCDLIHNEPVRRVGREKVA
jgi:hypothetical protein